LNQHYFKIISTQNIESKCKLKSQTYWINTNLVLNYLELKMNWYYFNVDIWVDTVDTIIPLKQHNLSVEWYINHFNVSNQHYLNLNVDLYFKSINSIDTKIVLNQHFRINTILLFMPKPNIY
jgi:hypothetical protein